jgi:predicted extracellular nuclease
MLSVRPLLVVVATALSLLAVGGVRLGPAEAVSADLFFSEYVEGTSNNKALEIFNGTGAPVDLAAGGYAVSMHFNGNPTPRSRSTSPGRSRQATCSSWRTARRRRRSSRRPIS